MAFYHWRYDDVMQLPIAVFWSMYAQINRVKAENDLRAMSVTAYSQSKEGFEKMAEQLTHEMGVTVKVDPIKSAKRDEGAIDELRALM